MTDNRLVRVAGEDESWGLEVMTLADLVANLDREQQTGGTRYRRAEYVENDSPYSTWEDVRRYGYTTRAHVPYRRR